MSDDKEVSSLDANDDAELSAVPKDFPRSVRLGAVSGARPKILASEYKGHFYPLGCTPPELYERWQICEDLAKQLSEKSLESKVGKRAHMSEADILDQYLPRLIAQKWTSEDEARWIIRRVAETLSWPVPASAVELGNVRSGDRA